jgi:hypothetical protein
MNTQGRTTATRPGKITATHLTSLGSRLTDRDRPFVLLAVPTTTRAKLAREAVADTGAPITVAEWSMGSTNSPLQLVTEIADQIVGRRLSQARNHPA